MYKTLFDFWQGNFYKTIVCVFMLFNDISIADKSRSYQKKGIDCLLFNYVKIFSQSYID